MATPSNIQQAGYNYMGSYAPAAQTEGARPFMSAPVELVNAPRPQVGPTSTPQGQTETEKKQSAEDAYWAWRKQSEQGELDRLRREQRENASSFLRTILQQYNLGELADSVDSLVTSWGTNTEVIAEKLRQTEPYKQRFKGLLNLQQRGITDVRNEADYLRLETEYRQIFRDNDMQDYLGQAGSRAEQDKIAAIVGDFSLSVNEVRDRVIDARRVVADTPEEVKESLTRFYNIDPATLTQFVLDPMNTTEMVNRRANAAIVGGYGMRAGLQFGADVSERVGEFLGRGDDVSGTMIEPTLTRIARTQRSTERLAQIEGGELTAEETALGTLELEGSAAERIRGLQSRERARFSGTSGITSASLARSSGI